MISRTLGRNLIQAGKVSILFGVRSYAYLSVFFRMLTEECRL